MSDPIQVWVRTDKGKVYGPLLPNSVELLIDNGVIAGRVQVSLDGDNYFFPGRMPGIRMVFPKELWGDVVVEGAEQDAAWGTVVLPPDQSGRPAPVRVAAPAGGPVMAMAGPGAIAHAAARNLAPTAGPGARAQATQRPMNPAAARPSSPGMPMPVMSPPMAPPAHVAPPRPSMAPPPPPAPSGPAPAPAPSAPPRVSLEPLQAGAPPASGTLSANAGLRLYVQAASTNSTALLSVTLPDRIVSVHFKKGSPEYAESNHEEDALGAYLMRKGLATADQVAQAEAQKDRFGGELLPTLFGLGLLIPNSVLEPLAQRMLGLLQRVLLAEQGNFTFTPKELPAHRAFPLGNRWSVFATVLRQTPGIEVRRRMIATLDLPVMKGTGLVPTSELRLSPQETRALGQFTGVSSLNQLTKRFTAEADVLLRTAWMLQACEAVSFASTVLKTDEDAPPPAAIAPPPPAAIAPPPPAAIAPPPPAAIVPPPPAAIAPPPPAAIVPPPPAAIAPPAPVVPAAPAVPVRPVMAPPVMAPPVMAAPAPATSPSRAPTLKPASGVFPAAAPAPKPASGVFPAAAPAPKPASGVFPAASVPSSRGTVSSGVVAAAAATSPDVKELVDLSLAMKKQNHFEVLGIQRSADAAAVKAAYFKLARLHHPDTVPPGAPEAHAKAKADVFARISEAHKVLGDVALRKEYEGELDAGGTGEKVDLSKIFAAEEFFQKGQILIKARKFPEAVKFFDDAIKSNDAEGEYYAYRGYAAFFGYTDKKAGSREVLKDIDKGIAMNPRAARPYFFKGFILKTIGDLNGAKTAFKKCVELDPSDIDAQRELRSTGK